MSNLLTDQIAGKPQYTLYIAAITLMQNCPSTPVLTITCTGSCFTLLLPALVHHGVSMGTLAT